MTFLVLDKPKVSAPEELTLENVPNVIAEILIFGKQTDRAARIEAITARDKRFDQVSKLITETFKDFLVGESKSQSIGESNAMSELLEWRWHLPEGVTRQQHSEMVKTHREHLLVEEWPELVFIALDNQTPMQASKDSKLETPLRALILMLENAAQGQVFSDELGDKIRTKLGLADYEQIKAEPGQLLSSPIVQQYLDFTSLSDEQLLAVRNEAMAIGNMRVLKKVIAEALSRPESEAMPRDLCYSMMAHFTDDDDEALGNLEKAKEEAGKAGRPVGMYFVQEFEFRLTRGLTEKLPELLQTIQTEYLSDPEVEYQLVRVLDRFGIGPDRGPIRGGQQPGVPAPAGVPAPPAGGSGGAIWTPESGAPNPAANSEQVAAGEPEEKSSGLWIPE